MGYIRAPEVDKLEKELEVFCGTCFAIGVSTGIDTLLIALMAIPRAVI
jgi:dTDP-4-amino-4,6-dideoxygalactose transaminase